MTGPTRVASSAVGRAGTEAGPGRADASCSSWASTTRRRRSSFESASRSPPPTSPPRCAGWSGSTLRTRRRSSRPRSCRRAIGSRSTASRAPASALTRSPDSSLAITVSSRRASTTRSTRTEVMRSHTTSRPRQRECTRSWWARCRSRARCATRSSSPPRRAPSGPSSAACSRQRSRPAAACARGPPSAGGSRASRTRGSSSCANAWGRSKGRPCCSSAPAWSASWPPST